MASSTASAGRDLLGYAEVAALIVSYRPGVVHAECDLLCAVGHEVGVCSRTGYDTTSRDTRLVWQRVGEQRGQPLEDRRL